MRPISSITDLSDALDLARVERILANSLAAELDAELAKARNKYEDRIKAHAKTEKAYLALVQDYATAHRAEILPKGTKSAAIGAHELGWVDNGGAVKMLRGASEKKAVARLVKAGGALARYFVRQTPALDKEAVAAKWAAFGPKLRRFGVTFRREETFFIKLDITQAAPARITPEKP
jgi:phage host-nuclease inhibitor protein Gam